MVFLGGDDPIEQAKFAKHLLAASVMSAPAAVVAAKILVPEEEEFDQSLEVTKDKIGSNVLEAIANGTGDGIKLAVNVGAMLLVFIALMAFGNAILLKVGQIGGLNEIIASSTRFDGLSFQFLLGYLCSPIAWLMGVPSEDMILVGQLIGEKTVLNEFVAYLSLGSLKAEGAFIHEKSIIMATYILCGFANFASIGIQIGGIGALIPERKALLSELGIRALVGGTLACMFYCCDCWDVILTQITEAKNHENQIHHIFCCFVFSLFSCGKYDDGPKMSFRSKAKRLEGTWHAVYQEQNGSEYLDDYTLIL